jgi:divalent metal cation (Fe/Co/Zn/Cd) transporter
LSSARREVWSALFAMSDPLLHFHSERRAYVESALLLSYATIGWNGLVGTAALGVAFSSGSLALAGFALNALLDSTASGVLVWRFRQERKDPAAAEDFERRALGWIALAMFLVALYVGVQATRALAQGSHPKSSTLGVVLAALSIAVLPWLGRRKLVVAAELGSPALRGDGVLTLAAAALAAITLAALVFNSAFDWWWADPIAALAIAVGLGVEAVRVTVRHRFG